MPFAFKICLVDDFGHFTDQTNLERRCFPHVYFTFQYFHTYILHFYSICVLDKRPFCSDITWRTSYFRLFCIGLCPKEIVKLCNCVDSKLSESLKSILYQEDSYKFRMSIHNFGFRIGFLSSSAMERREDGAQRMLGSLPWIDSQFVGLCAEL